MKNNLKIALLKYWIEYPSKIGEVPEKLKDDVSREDAQRLLQTELPGKHKRQDFLDYIDKIRARIEIKRRARVEEKLVRMQKSTNTSQCMIVIIMAMTLLVSSYLTGKAQDISEKTYNITFELTRPNLNFYAYCPASSENGLIPLSFQITNNGNTGGKAGVKIYGTNILFERVREEDGYINWLPLNSSRTFYPDYIEPQKSRSFNITLKPLADSDMTNFKIRAEAFCETPNCKFNTGNNAECEYVKNGSSYVRVSNSGCVE